MSNWVQLLPIVLLVAVFWFLVVRPARVRQREFLQTQSELAVGDRVMISSGIFGEIAVLGDETIDLRIAPETVVTVNRQAVARVITAPGTPELEKGIDD